MIIFMNSPDCSICLEPIEENETTTTLTCGHSFHKDCIDEWIQASSLEIPDIETTTIQRQWQCPLCRHMSYETQEEQSDSLLSFSIVTFRTKRYFIKLFTFLDSVTSFFSFIVTTDPYFALWCVAALYGYNGATNFNIFHLRLYVWFCICPIIFRCMHMYTFVENAHHITIYPPSNSFITISLLSFGLFIQLYVVYCIHYISIYINIYQERMVRYLRHYGDI